MDRIKRLSYELLDEYQAKFGEDFTDNKKVLDQVSIIRSKGLKNEIAGYITKFIKKQVREEQAKAKRDSLESEEQIESVQEDPDVPTEIEENVVETKEEAVESDASEEPEETTD